MGGEAVVKLPETQDVGLPRSAHISRSSQQRLNSAREVVWGDTLDLGDILIWDGVNECPDLFLRFAVYLSVGHGDAQLLGMAEQPLLELVQGVWEDNNVAIVFGAQEAKPAAQ